MGDSSNVKLYISHLNKQIQLLEPEIKKFTSKSLDEQLLLLKNEKEKLTLTNKYAYILSSLCFIYMKVLDVKDLTPIMNELERIKEYMNKAKNLDSKESKELQQQKTDQERARKIITTALDGRHTQPSVSIHNFRGKHTKFDNTEENSPELEERKELVNKVMKKLTNSKKKIVINKVNKKSK